MRLGIDFGTCNSSAALMIDGNLRLVKEPARQGYSFPSSIYLEELDKVLVGQLAESNKFKDITRYRKEFKRDLLQKTPYILGQNGEYEFTPQRLVTEVLKTFKQETEKITLALDKGEITDVVLTVPATYLKNKREVMEQAALDAGFTSVGLIEEPVASAIYYNDLNPASFKEEDIILVYDLGGGTFDATLIKKSGKSFQILGRPTGIENCGGIDFDRVIFEDVKNRCNEQLKKNLVARGNLPEKNFIIDFCRDIKHQLSGIENATGYIPIDYQFYDLNRDDFNRMIEPYVERTTVLCEDLIKSVGLELQDISKVLMVGGSCRIPYIQESIEKSLKSSVLLIDEPELAVCQGAASKNAVFKFKRNKKKMNKTTQTTNNKSLQTLKTIFKDRPEVLRLLDYRELDESQLTDEELARELKKRKLYPEPINFYATGRTGAGKTSLGNRLLVSEGTPMESHGRQDCTKEVQHFLMASNLQYFDLPGAGSDEDYENINRAALALKQIDDEDEEITPISQFIVRDFSNYATTKKYTDKAVKVSNWQSEQNQKLVAPDIILYVFAPHGQFLRPDRKYLRTLLKSLKKKGNNNKVIFALNIHRNIDETIKPTPQNIEDAQNKITKVYQEFYDDIPPIVEINALKGTGINQITELMCQILPLQKIGNMQQVLRDELKQFARKERSRRYRQALIYIASRLATYKVDQDFGTKSLLQEVYAAVYSFGVQIFREEDIRIDAKNATHELEDIVNNIIDDLAVQSKQSREEIITKLVRDVDYKTVTKDVMIGSEPVYGDVEIEEELPTIVEDVERQKRSNFTRGTIGTGEVVTHGIFGLGYLAEAAYNKLTTGKFESKWADNVHGSFDEAAHKYEKVAKIATEKIKRKRREIIEIKQQKEQVTEQIPFVIEREQEVGRKFLQGGYPVVENIFAIGLGIEQADPDQDLRTILEELMKSGRLQAVTLLRGYEEKINALAISSNPTQAEEEIIKVLESAFSIQ